MRFGGSSGGLKVPVVAKRAPGRFGALKIDLPFFLDLGVLGVAFAGYGRSPAAPKTGLAGNLVLDV